MIILTKLKQNSKENKLEINMEKIDNILDNDEHIVLDVLPASQKYCLFRDLEALLFY